MRKRTIKMLYLYNRREMMKIFSSEQIRDIDTYTIKNEPVSPTDLMERAAGGIFSWCLTHFSKNERYIIFVGPGNNGGDGLALARMLACKKYNVEVYFVNFTSKRSAEWEINRRRLEESGLTLRFINKADDFPAIPKDNTIIIDSIFGSGLSKPSDGLSKEIIEQINSRKSPVVAIDIPSGLFCENNTENDESGIIHADYTLTFQFPKLSFMFAENYKYTGEWEVLDIGLHPDAINSNQTDYIFFTANEAKQLLKNRNRFDHKGIFGHALLIAGSYGKMGAAILSGKAALRSGVGLLTCHIPGCGYEVIQNSIPEAMVKADGGAREISGIDNFEKFSAVGVGPGIGTSNETTMAIINLLKGCNKPLVIDADCINIISQYPELLSSLPENTILTPHPGEFDRLTGKSVSGNERFRKQVDISKRFKIIVVLKGAYTSVSMPDGKVYFNSTGNPGMATAGSGDVLTGVIVSLLAQGYAAADAALLGVFVHGHAGDVALKATSYESLIASDIIYHIGDAFNNLRSNYDKN
ncbi:MAG TPA: NAD(P)H-hydrate dehydratase [Bacteroidales bacterium]|nr:NAD(P)H-hydrate dehydratase [Bacteroidales bacterium]